MSEQPKACSSCGKQPQGNNWHTYGKNPKDEMRYFCANHDCPNGLRKAVTLDEWNTRPIEDALRAELAEAQAELEQLRALTATHGMKLCPGCEKLTEHEKYCEVWECRECGCDSESGFVGLS